MNTPTFQGSTSASKHTARDTKADTGGKEPARFRRTVVHAMFAPLGSLGDPDMPENPSNDMTQNAKAKSPKAQLVAQIARLVRKAGLDYEGWRYVARGCGRLCDLRPEKKGRRLPRVLTTEEFRRFYQVVDRAEDVQHALMLRLLFFTAVQGQRTLQHRNLRR